MTVSIKFGLFPRGEDWSWLEQAACKGMSQALFFTERGEIALDAKEICLRCHVREQCLDYALRYREQFGIWGGKSPKQRVALRRELRPNQTGDIPAGMKRCSRCGHDYPAENFHRSKSGRDGLHTQCKNCRNQLRKELQRRGRAS